MFVKTFWNFASQIMSFAVSFADRFVLVAILLRAWPIDLYSDWVMISACASLLGLCDLGFVIFLGNQLQKVFSQGDSPSFQRLLGFGLFIYIVLGTLLVGVVFALALLNYFYPFLSIRSLAPASAIWVFLLLGLVQIVHSTKSAITQIFRAHGDYARGSVIDSVASVVITASAIIAALLGAQPIVMALTYLCAHVVGGWGLLLTGIRWHYPYLRLRPVVPRASELREAGGAMKWYAFIYAAPSILLQVPVLLLSVLGLGGSALVVFVVHRSFVNFARTLIVMLSTAGGIELSPQVHIGNTSEVKRGITILGRIIAACGGALAVGLLYFGPATIRLWTGKADLFDPATMFWLLVPILAVAPAIPLLSLAQYAGLARPLAISNLAQIGVSIPVCLLFGKLYGASGIAFGLAVAESLAVGLLLPAMTTKHLQINYYRHWISCLAISAGALVWAGAVALAIGSVTGAQTPLMLFFAVSGWSALTFLPIGYLLLPAGQRSRLGDGLFGIVAIVRANLIRRI